jgi:hemerythrin
MPYHKVPFIEWNDRLSTGIAVTDLQHRALLRMTNDLCTSCLYGGSIAGAYFSVTARRTMEYIRLHFLTEELVMTEIRFPDLAEHRRQHRQCLRDLRGYIGKFEAGARHIPRRFARRLTDWLLTHVSVADKQYGDYYAFLGLPGDPESGIVG